MQGNGDGMVGYQDTQARGFDRFVVRDWYNIQKESWNLNS